MSRPIDASLPGFLGNGETNSTVTDNQNETVYHLSSPSVSSAAVPGVALDIASTTNSVLAPCEAQTHETNEAALYFGPNMATGREFASVDPRDGGPISEIQEIMGQFDNNDMTLKVQAHESPRLSPEFPSLNLSTNHPPRKSSLKPFRAASVHSESSSLLLPGSASVNDISEVQRKMVEVTMNDQRSIQVSGHATRLNSGDINNIPHSSPASASSQKPHPPEPESAPGLSFDFHRFLEQLRHRTADPVAKFLRSFLVEFGKKQWMPHEQAKIIGDFLAFIANKMALCEIWRELSDAEFDNAKEGMEKLVMNRLYSQTFSPAIPNPTSVPRAKNKGTILDRSVGRGRTGQHQEDIERDEILSQKVRIYGWVREEHLDILHVGDGGKRFLALAQQELLKINTYRAPRDKIICVLNCCKVIFGLLRSSKASDTSADSFVPLLIYVVLQANPDHLVSNVHYILRFRNKEKLNGEAGYYLSSLMGAIQFIENLDRTTLTVSDAEFESNVESAVSAIAERHGEEVPLSAHHSVSECSSVAGKGSQDTIPVNGLLRTIKKPLTNMSRIFSEDRSTSPHPIMGEKPDASSASSSLPSTGLSPAVFQPPRTRFDEAKTSEGILGTPQVINALDRDLSIDANLPVKTSSEMAQIRRIERDEHKDVVETLVSMFPNLDKELIDDVVRMKQRRVELAVDACLALST